jgi:hypothetical protein
MANCFFDVKNPFVGFASPFFGWPDCENSPEKKKTSDFFLNQEFIF